MTKGKMNICMWRAKREYAEPVMTYTVETRAENALTKRSMRTTEMRTLRFMFGCSLLDHVRRDDIRSKCDIQDVVRWAHNRGR